MLKKTAILNPALLQAMASLGQNDYLVIANAAFPVDPGIPVIDLSLTAGLPSMEQVLAAVADELVLDSTIQPSEWKEDKAADCREAADAILGELPVKPVMYEQVKVLAKHARAVVRTGDVRPYASLILLAAGIQSKE